MGYKMNKEMAIKAYEDYNATGSLVKVAMKYDVTPMCLHKWFRTLGLKVNSKREAGKMRKEKRNQLLRQLYESGNYPSLVMLSEAAGITTTTAKRGLEEIYAPKKVKELFPFSRATARRNISRVPQVITMARNQGDITVISPAIVKPETSQTLRQEVKPDTKEEAKHEAKPDVKEEKKEEVKKDILPPPDKIKSLRDRLFDILS